MELHDKIQNAYKACKNYPELAKALAEIGVQSYTVDVSTGTILYRFLEGNTVLHEGQGTIRHIAEKFNLDETVETLRSSQQGKITYPEFMMGIAKSGVRFYEATLNGNKKRVTYIGTGGSYEELIPF